MYSICDLLSRKFFVILDVTAFFLFLLFKLCAGPQSRTCFFSTVLDKYVVRRILRIRRHRPRPGQCQLADPNLTQGSPLGAPREGVGGWRCQGLIERCQKVAMQQPLLDLLCIKDHDPGVARPPGPRSLAGA